MSLRIEKSGICFLGHVHMHTGLGYDYTFILILIVKETKQKKNI